MKQWLLSKYVQLPNWYNTPRQYTNGDGFEILLAHMLIAALWIS
jgi:hypothetical protein